MVYSGATATVTLSACSVITDIATPENGTVTAAGTATDTVNPLHTVVGPLELVSTVLF